VNTFEDEPEADAESVDSPTFAGERAREPRAVARLLIRDVFRRLERATVAAATRESDGQHEQNRDGEREQQHDLPASAHRRAATPGASPPPLGPRQFVQEWSYSEQLPQVLQAHSIQRW